jgi:uncharacterized protein (DUF2147 family)
MRKFMKICSFLAAILLTAINALGAGPDDILGSWKTEGGKSALEFFRCGEKICGKIVWLKVPLYIDSADGPVGKPKVDLKNPKPALRHRPILGLQVMNGVTATGDNRWEHGTCYDPESGNTYKCKMRLTSPHRLEIRGYIGISLFGRTYVLTR